MAWDKSKYSSISDTDFSTLGTITTKNVLDAAKALSAPLFVSGATNKSSRDRWDYTFYAYYQVTIKSLTITLAVHRHITVGRSGATAGPGNMYIPGYDGWSATSDSAFDSHFPTYAATTHVDGWCSDSAAQRTFFTGTNRYPHR